MCIHETTQMTDEHRIIMCGDCGREFARLARDKQETLVVPIESQSVLLIPTPDSADLAEWPEIAFRVTLIGGTHLSMIPVYPCARCGFDGTCPEYHGEDCHV